MPNASDEPTAANASAVATAEQAPARPYAWHRPPARVIIKADLLPAVSLLFAIPLLGMGVGWLWSRLAPPQRMLVRSDQPVPLPTESYHRFDDLALYLVLCLGAGVATGLGVWFLRERRGPVIMLAAVLGAVAAGWLAMTFGRGQAEGRYTVSGIPNVGDVVEKAPMLESAWAIVAWPLTTALVYGILAAWNGLDDLGRRLG